RKRRAARARRGWATRVPRGATASVDRKGCGVTLCHTAAPALNTTCRRVLWPPCWRGFRRGGKCGSRGLRRRRCPSGSSARLRRRRTSGRTRRPRQSPRRRPWWRPRTCGASLRGSQPRAAPGGRSATTRPG
ncbi:hypothetical protein T484DRAFT_1894259, partial [Baffinella frigidus]